MTVRMVVGVRGRVIVVVVVVVVPLSLSRVPAGRGGLGLGFYFGALSATSGLAAWRFRAPISIGEASTFAFIGLAVVAAAIWAGQRPNRRR